MQEILVVAELVQKRVGDSATTQTQGVHISGVVGFSGSGFRVF